ncbi:peptide methionine sulfoxide reductase [Hymenobacter roseosalivarius DSM 11622]|uniref:Peptide methionine sulfoxide reductase MsrA n=1 Tax=Hymenobacter roseosalivarius DSM 11622 TaxID=645990 RepID=A0A1W1VQE5_9BACT|nr:peptide-methionine (S)-S-oxide reductase MsrA [Hymenobacter roseosalivarius]SMB95450.1 peptide methionine sulfoxide reductase [Hymenobacter roseosalivarius DSM 11622]
MIRHLKFYLLGVLLGAVACSQNRSDAQPTRSTVGQAPTNMQGLAVATLAGGCFWCTEEVFEEVKGVREVVSGYAGGPEKKPTYEQVGSGRTGHAEAVQVYYDPKQVSYATLLDVFFRAAHDPTTLNRQGPDAGTQYRSVAFYRTPQEKEQITAAIQRVNAAKQYSNPIVTQVTAFTEFWPAEDYHQGYYRLHPNEPYIQSVSTPKVEKFRKLFPKLLQSPL